MVEAQSLFNFVNVLYKPTFKKKKLFKFKPNALINDHVSGKKGITLHLNKLESYSPKDALSFIWLKPRVFLILSMYFR